MNKQGNIYTIIYSSVMVIIVAALLAFTAMSLKPAQEKNIAVDKMKQILSAVNIEANTENAQELYRKYISRSFVINSKGEDITGDAFETILPTKQRSRCRTETSRFRMYDS